MLRSNKPRAFSLRGGDDTVRTVLLPEGHCLFELHDRRLRVSRWDDTLWVGLLSEGHGVREPLDLDVRDCGGRLYTGPGGVWQDVLCLGRMLQGWKRMRRLLRLHYCKRRLLQRPFLLD
jgi:hypothetical protein